MDTITGEQEARGKKTVFDYSLHKAMWSLIADNIERGMDKEEALLELGKNPLAYTNVCPACEATMKARYDCNRCPLDWTGGECCTENLESEYDDYCSAVSGLCEDQEAIEAARAAAKRIANLTLKETAAIDFIIR